MVTLFALFIMLYQTNSYNFYDIVTIVVCFGLLELISFLLGVFVGRKIRN